MGRTLADYIAMALVGVEPNTEDDPFAFGERAKKDFNGDMAQLRAYAEQSCGFPVSPENLDAAVRILADCNLIRINDDAFSGTFYRIYATRFDEFRGGASKQLSTLRDNGFTAETIIERRSDHPAAAAMLMHPIVEDYDEHGSIWLRRALQGIAAAIEAGELDHTFAGLLQQDRLAAPASNRVVSFSHNEIESLNDKANELIDAVSTRNEVGGEPRIRDMVLGQLRAGLELIRSGCVRVYLLQVTFIETLTYLAKRYEKEVIGALAASLLTKLMQIVTG